MNCRPALWLGILLFVIAASAHAQSTTDMEPYEEFGDHLRAAQEVTPLKSDLFGDQVSLYNGSTEFDVTDINLPGNSGLPVQLRRRLVINDRRLDPGRIAGMGDWDVDVPYIEGLFTQQDGWVVVDGSGNRSTERCSIPALPYVTFGTWPYSVSTYAQLIWDGNELHIPGNGEVEMLQNTEAKLPAVADGNTYPWVTKNYYRFGCLATTQGLAGESFYALSPSGEKYTFNWAVERVAPTLGHIYNSSPVYGPVGWIAYPRYRIFLLATQVEDRFGNWVKYTYDGAHLTAITANDGREIDLTWSGDTVIRATAGDRTWSYGYANGSLTSVTRPDSTTWNYTVISGSLQTVKTLHSGPLPKGECEDFEEASQNDGNFVYRIDSPSGARGTFTFTYFRHYRDNVPYSCLDGNPNHGYPTVYDYFDNFSLISKQISGAALGALTWTYAYGERGGYFTASDPYPGNVETYIPPGLCDTCKRSKTVTVTGPGDVVTYTFGSNYGNDEGRLLQTETDSLTGQVVRKVSRTYLTEDQIADQPFPPNVGQSVQVNWKNPAVGRLRPVVTTTTVQDGDAYTRENQAFDVFAQPTQVKRYNNIAGQSSITEQTTYFNDLQHWVLGQPQQVDNLSTGETESHDTYDPATALLASSSRFGEPLLSYTYNSAGQLASFTDGNSQTTTLGNYYRGIPRLINSPDSTSQSASVDDYGEITAVTDQAGHTTSYSYDPSGWPKEIDYPTGDEAAWLPRTFQFDYVNTAERGIPAGHWRRTVSTGNYVETTYFDAMLRPLLTDTSITGTAGSDISSGNIYDWRGLTTYASYPVSGALDLTTLTIGAQAIGTRTTYDTLGRPTQAERDSELGPLTSTTAYLPGAAVQVTDPRGKITTTHYQVFDEPSTSAPIMVQAPEGVTQTIVRDLYGKPLSITQSGLYNGTETDSVTKTLAYDVYQRLCRTTEPETGDSSISYDGANNVRQTASGLTLTESGCARDQVPSAAAINYTYNPVNRLKTVQPPAGTQSTTYYYTPTGNVDHVVSGGVSGTSTWSAHYNFRDMLTDETLALTGQDPWTIGYAHDTYGNLAQLTYPDGEIVAYNPNPRGRARQAGSYASQISYFPDGQVSGFVYGNGTAYAAAQNTRQLLSNFSYGSAAGTLNLSEDLSYDPNGNILSVQDLVNGQRSKTFQYDDLNRLKTAVAPALWGTEQYTYDPLNNLRTRLTQGQTNVYNYDGPTNRLANITRAGSTIGSFGYDNLGNENSRNGVTLQFDQKNQLQQIPGVDSYQYDAAGRRTVKTSVSGGASTYTFYNHAGQLLYQIDQGKSQATDFIYLGTKMIARDASLHLGAPGAVTFDSNPNNGNYTVSWGAVPAATSYILQESANGGAWTTVYSGSATSASMSGKDGGSYIYQARGCVGSTCGDWTGSETLGVTPKLSVVSGPTDLVFGSYTVSWTAPISASAYMVQERFNGGAWTTIVDSTPATSIVLARPVGGTYDYQVSAYNEYGSRGWSAPITVHVTQVPETPTNLVVTTTDGLQTATWDAMPFATSYRVISNAIPPRLGESMMTISGTSFTAAAGDAVSEVQACSIAGCSSPAYNGLTHLEPLVPTVSGPTDLVFGTYTVSWTATAGASGYNVQESVNGGAWNTIASATTATSISRPGTAGGTYQYQVAAWNNYGSRGWSAPITVSVTQVPDTPTNFTVGTASGGFSVLSWDAMAWATSYQLTAAGINGTLGTYTYKVGTNSFNLQTGKYTAKQLTACSIAGCSAPLIISNGLFTVGGTGTGTSGDASSATTKVRRLGADTSVSSGCTATLCTAVLGGNP